jgi:hypothetical protein
MEGCIAKSEGHLPETNSQDSRPLAWVNKCCLHLLPHTSTSHLLICMLTFCCQIMIGSLLHISMHVLELMQTCLDDLCVCESAATSKHTVQFRWSPLQGFGYLLQPQWCCLLQFTLNQESIKPDNNNTLHQLHITNVI